MKRILAVLIIIFITDLIIAESLEDIKKKLRMDVKEESKIRKGKETCQVIGKYCIVNTTDLSELETERIQKFTDRLVEEFLKIFNYPFGTRKCHILVYGIQEDYINAAKKKNRQRAGGFAYKKGVDHYTVTYYSENLYSTLSHETLHMFIENIFKKDVPPWLNEGMACYYETCAFTGDKFTANRINERFLNIAKENAGTVQWPGINELIRISSYNDFYRCASSINYAASWSLLYFLKNKDEEAFKNFIHDLVLGKSFSTAVRTNYKLDIKELEKEWIVYINNL